MLDSSSMTKHGRPADAGGRAPASTISQMDDAWVTTSRWCKLGAKSSRPFLLEHALVLSRDLLHLLARPLAGPATLCDR